MSTDTIPKRSIVASAKSLASRGPLLALRRRLELLRWNPDDVRKPAPHLLKQRVIREHAARHGLRVLVETGTYLGEMVAAMAPHFDRVFSIELSPALAENARRRFRNYSNVEILEGDSGEVLESLLARLREPCLFWLDGHYSGGVTARSDVDTPVVAEIDSILRHSVTGHAVLIDDARCFGSDKDYPSLDELRARIARARSGLRFEARHDIIRITEG